MNQIIKIIQDDIIICLNNINYYSHPFIYNIHIPTIDTTNIELSNWNNNLFSDLISTVSFDTNYDDKSLSLILYDSKKNKPLQQINPFTIKIPDIILLDDDSNDDIPIQIITIDYRYHPIEYYLHYSK